MTENLNIYDQGKTLLFNKPYRWTSFDLVKKIRSATGAHRVGHAGTLDPLATGLLIVCTGKHTKTISEIQDQEKEYTGKMIIGAITASYDRETPAVGGKPFEHITPEMIEEVANAFLGETEQIPPDHSAKKIEGKRAYTLARKGVATNLSPVNINIKEFEITGVNLPSLEFRVVCSKGTYIRSLVHDYGKKLGTGAYLHSLCRTRIGSYRLEDARNVFEFIDKLRAENQELKAPE
jgi:tRNA pseudouridine55 synthase